jgi:poly-gamma-glutamate capsule biosynthesis protein CapA/YwtB (metallophosphatase superfamily)/outer membrane protein assembly factor BamB
MGYLKTDRKPARGNASPIHASPIHSVSLVCVLVCIVLVSCAPTTALPTPSVPPATVVPTPVPTPAPVSTLPPAPTLPPPLPLGLQRFWRAATNDTVWQVGAVDVEGDGKMEIYAASYDHSLYLLNGDGTVRWSYATTAPVYAALPGDLDGDGRPEFLCGGDDGAVHAVGSDGQERWSYSMGGRVTHLAVGDVDKDGRPEVVAANWAGDLYILDNAGREKTRILLTVRPTVLLVQDLDSDSQAEILVGTEDGFIRALDAAGNVRWQQGLEGAVRALATADVDQDGRPEVVVASQTGVVALIGADGVPRWARRAAGTVLSLAVLPQDNLLLLGQAEGLLALDGTEGEPAWEEPAASSVWTIAVAESPAEETVIAAGTDDGSILLLNRRGQLRGRTQLPSRVHTVVWADLESTGLAELLARSGDYVYTFRQVTEGAAGEGIREVATFPLWPDPSPFPPTPEGYVSMVVAGDIMLARSIEERAAALGLDYPFRALAPLLQQADIAVANLECALSLDGTPAALPYILRAHPSVAAGLKETGFDVLNLANNHSLDYGPAGLTETISVLESQGIHPVGGGRQAADPVIVEVRGVRVAILARNASPNSPTGIAAAWDTGALQRDIRAARAQADVLVLLLHTGQDPTAEPDAEQRSLARAAIDAGAALVVGYHRYQVLDTEAYQDGFIAYALGDFVADIDIEDTARDGAVLQVLLNKKGLAQVNWIPTRIVNDVQPQAVAAPGGRLASRPLLTRVSEPLPPAPSPRATYVLSATLAPQDGLLTVRERIAFPNNTGDTLSDLNLFVFPNALTETFFLRDVEVLQRGRRSPPSYALAGTTLHIFLAESVQPGEAITISLDYSLSLPLLDAQSEPPADNLGVTSDGRIVQLGHWYPQLVPYRRGYGWETWDFHPVGDPFFTDPASYQVMLTAPADFRAFASVPGRLEGQSRYFSLDPARDLALLVARDYDTVTQVVDGITVTSAFRREDREAGRAVLADTARALRLFQERYGPYPYGTFTVVEGEMFGGMEYSGMVLVGSPFYGAYQAQVDHKEQTVLPTLAVHELAHQWWYNVVGNDQVHEPWLDESLARYSEFLYYENAYTQSLDWWWQSRVDGWGPTGFLDSTIYDYTDTVTYVHNLYGLGAHFIQDLRTRMGDEVFFPFLQRYYREYAWQRATRRDFFRLVGETGVAVDDLVQVYFQK